jgi:hypothetical protein
VRNVYRLYRTHNTTERLKIEGIKHDSHSGEKKRRTKKAATDGRINIHDIIAEKMDRAESA